MKTKPNKIYRLNLIIALLVLLLSSCSRGPSETPTTVPPTSTTVALPTNTDIPEPTTVPLPSPQPTREPIPNLDSAVDTATALFAAEHPPVDYYRLAQQIQGITPDELTPEVAAAPDWQVNDRADFIVNVDLAGDYSPVPARLRHISENVAWWATVRVDLSDEEIESAAEMFEAEMLPINRMLFGREWSPGIDKDLIIHVLFVDEPRWGSNYFGYFSNTNEYPTAIFPQSNQKEMIVVSAIAVSVDSVNFTGKLGHEYQHLIQWNTDPNEDQWLNEALSELANFLSGAPPTSSALGYTNLELFALNPDIQLTSRPEKRYGDLDKAAFMHYGAERLFAVYLFEQFGAQFIIDVAENPAPGVISLQQELDKLPGKPRFQEVYAAWLLANLLNQPNLLEGQYGYQDIKPVLPERELIRSFDGEVIADQLPPYGARYYEIRSDVDLTCIFTGTTLARLTPADPFSGEYAWYSNRGDESEFSLTHTFDLTEVESATLNYQVWYELEEFYDYGYVEVSTDDGESWTFLKTTHGTDQNPNERASGFGYTGTTLEWLEESIDLSPFAGQTIQLRFEVITDFTTNRDGLQLDDIAIPEIGYSDGAEDDSGGWEASGFIRSSNFVPAEWIVWLLKLGVGLPTQVERIEMGTDQSAEFEIAGFGEEFSFAAVVVSPTAPVTTMELDYELLFEHR